MNKRLAVLLAGVMAFSCFVTAYAYDTNDTYSDAMYIDTPHIRTTDSSTTTTGGSTTTTGGGNSISYNGREKDPRFGFRDKVITTDKGTIEILDNGSIITTGETTYDPKTGSFKKTYFMDAETIFYGDYYGIESGKIRYGSGSVITRDYSCIFKGEIYALNEGDIYTRWILKDDEVAEWNIMPLFSFMKIDNKWVFFDSSTILYSRYKENELINELVATNRATVQLEEDIEVKDLSSSMSRTSNSGQTKVLPDGCLLIVTEGRSHYITQRGIIPKDTIINYQDGSVELIKNDMTIVGNDINVRIQNLNGDNSDIGFESYVINKTDTENPPVTPSPSPEPSPIPPTDNDSDDSSYKETVIVKPQSLDKTKRYQYSVEDNLTIRKGNEVIKLKKGDKIILPNGTESVLTELPKGTKLINSGKTVILNGGYSLSRKVSFKVIEERDTIELFIEMFLGFFNKLK